jgi:hypothetical protein
VADPLFEKPNFDARYLPYPPLELRVALRAAQAILYHHQVPLSKADLAMDSRMFYGGASFFSQEFSQRIQSEAQFLKFQARLGKST